MKNKIITKAEAVKHVKDGDVLLLGGFLQGGCPDELLAALYDETDVKGITVVNNDTQFGDSEINRLLSAGRIKKFIGSYPGFNPNTVNMIFDGSLELELSPQGTLAERIRAAGAGLGGVLTPTGFGTIIEEGKQVLEVDGKDYILEKPIKGNVAFIYATKCDIFGNIFIHGTARNFNTVMATAADYVICCTGEIIDGPMDPDMITIPGVFIDAITLKEEK